MTSNKQEQVEIDPKLPRPDSFEDVLANYTLDQTLFDYLAAFCRIASPEEAMMDGKLPSPRYVEL